ncbi:MAG: thiolase domain-containing protein [Candidatus Aenigmarchaeota archaeon]|nr:thiolase domain-containing protein [Candidatus Aenigmarchaeota archaeon]
MTRVGIVAVGQSKFGELWEHSLRDLAVDAGNAVFKDLDTQTKGNITKKNIEGLFVGNMGAGSMAKQSHLGSLVSDYVGITGVPAVRCEGACSSGALAFRHAFHTIKSGEMDVAMVLGIEKMTDIDSNHVLNALMEAGDFEWESLAGLTFTGLYALMARRHMKEFGTTRNQLSLISVNNHKNGVKNPYAQFRGEITIEDVEKSTLIADPLRTLDCSPITDGAASVIIASEEFIKKNKLDNVAWILSSSAATDRIGFFNRRSIVELDATKLAVKRVIEKDRVNMKNIGVTEVHDCFSINELVALEDLGFCEKGKGGKFIEQGEIKLDGQIPTNTTGGLKSIGHPVGATGVRQLIDITKQIRGDSLNQLKNVNQGLALNIGGIGTTSVIHVLGKD